MSIGIPDRLLGENLDILQTGRWWVVELDEPKIAAQGESKEEALYKLAKRLEKHQDRRSHDSEWADHSNKRGSRARDADEMAATR
jgi:hypothetical protein